VLSPSARAQELRRAKSICGAAKRPWSCPARSRRCKHENGAFTRLPRRIQHQEVDPDRGEAEVDQNNALLASAEYVKLVSLYQGDYN
jgi:hypothetical protein